MSNMMLTEVSLIDSAILHSHTFGHTTALSTCIRPNNINHQEKRHHSRRGAPTKAQHKGSKEIQCRSKKYSVQGSKTLTRNVCQDLVLQYLLPSPSNVQMRKHHQGKSRKYVRVGNFWQFWWILGKFGGFGNFRHFWQIRPFLAHLGNFGNFGQI